MRRLFSGNAPMEAESPFFFISERELETGHGDERSYSTREAGENHEGSGA